MQEHEENTFQLFSLGVDEVDTVGVIAHAFVVEYGTKCCYCNCDQFETLMTKDNTSIDEFSAGRFYHMPDIV